MVKTVHWHRDLILAFTPEVSILLVSIQRHEPISADGPGENLQDKETMRT